MDAKDTLIQLLSAFRQDLQFCMQNESKDFMMSQPGGDGGQSEVADPILLGDFVVDAFNRYLTQAQELTGNATVHAIPTISPLGDAATSSAPRQDGDSRWPESRPRTHGSDPRLGKMAEVLLAAGQLLAVLQAQESGAENERADTLDTLLAALTALIEQVDRTHHGYREDMVRETVCPLAERYNAYLDLVVETCDDPIVPRLFSKIDVSDGHEDDANGRRVRAELAASGAGLVAYLGRLLDRAESASGMRGKVGAGVNKPTLPG